MAPHLRMVISSIGRARVGVKIGIKFQNKTLLFSQPLQAGTALGPQI